MEIIRVGQRILTQDLEEALVLQIEDSSYRLLLNKKVVYFSENYIFNIISGPTAPETEDVPYQVLRISAPTQRGSHNPPLSGGVFFSLGSLASWKIDVGGAELEIRGVVLRTDPYRTTLSEFGVSVAGREWIVPTQILSVGFLDD